MKSTRGIILWVTVLALGTVVAMGVVVTLKELGPPFRPDRITQKLSIVEGAKVTLEYDITLPDNTVIPSQVTQYVQGEHEILPAVERAVSGMKPGEQKRVGLSAEQAFGPYDEEKRVVVDKQTLPPGVESGMVLEMPDGQAVTVAAVTETIALLDYNHPLAGMPIVLDVKVLNVEPQVTRAAVTVRAFLSGDEQADFPLLLGGLGAGGGAALDAEIFVEVAGREYEQQPLPRRGRLAAFRAEEERGAERFEVGLLVRRPA